MQQKAKEEFFYGLIPETGNIAVSIPYQDPVYDTRTIVISIPYQEEYQKAYLQSYEEPEYRTAYSGSLEDNGLTTYYWTFKCATSWDKEYTGRDAWGNSEYTFTICGVLGCIKYPQINSWDISQSTVITGYVTKYKTEYRTEYKDVIKSKFEWLFN